MKRFVIKRVITYVKVVEAWSKEEVEEWLSQGMHDHEINDNPQVKEIVRLARRCEE